MSFLDKIRNWPEGKKRTFAVVTALVLTFVIVVGWGIFDAAVNRQSSNSDAFLPLRGTIDEFLNEFHSASANLASTTAAIRAEYASMTAKMATGTASTTATTSQKKVKK
ncbi:MAG: hypothetical protein KGH93_02525 [Patescibacteria group bacterium]|nr:hypothetical protein [Patescibacteria group bacterium]MDE1946050.1 hypothetical protein [Patescibacteria group bacterium]